MSDRGRSEEGTPLVPPRSLGGEGQRGRGTGGSQRPASGVQTQTREQSATRDRGATEQPTAQQRPARDSGQRGQESDAEKTTPLAMAAAAVAAAKERTVGASPRPEGVSRSEDQVRAAQAARPGRTRRARLRLMRIDPWSVMKTAFLLSIAFGIMCVVAVFIIWSVLEAANVFDSVNSSLESVVGQGFTIEDYVGMDRVLSFTMLVAVLDVVLITAVATLGAFLYNLAASLLGGLEVTLAEDDR
jgi:Transmembrane domain of unknown function (DUF3566)